MAGNVWEWTSSRYCPYALSGCDSQFYVLRGGCWGTSKMTFLRATQRDHAVLSRRVPNAGFRCAQTSK